MGLSARSEPLQPILEREGEAPVAFPPSGKTGLPEEAPPVKRGQARAPVMEMYGMWKDHQ